MCCAICRGMCVNIFVCVSASDRKDKSPGCCVLFRFFHPTQGFLSLWQSLHFTGRSLTGSDCDLSAWLSSTVMSFSHTPCLQIFFFSADVLTDRVIALEADVWTQDDIALHHELMLKLGRISGIHPYMSHLITQGGEETCLWIW